MIFGFRQARRITMAYKPAVRNYDNIQFADLRRVVDPQYGEFHDQLTAAYKDGGTFKHIWLKQWDYPMEIDFGALKATNSTEAKALFDELHALQDWKRQEKFHNENMKLSGTEHIPEEKYNIIRDIDGNIIGKKSDEILTKVNALKANKGLELVVG